MRLTFLEKTFPIFLFTVLLLFKICPAQTSFHFQGEVNANNINVRADSTINAEIICILNKGECIDVILELYEWYKIKLPKTAPVYIKKNMVECIGLCETAKVLKDRVNVRLYPNESSPILGKIDKNGVVSILEDKRDWFKIEPTENSFGWINKKFVNPAPFIVSDTEQKRSGVNLEGDITLIGIIKPYGKIIGRIATHKLITEDNKAFLLKGNKKSLDALNYHKVKIMGKIISPPQQKYPLIEINILEIIS